MTEIDWAHVASIAEKTARSVSAAWSVVEKDDVKQTILLHAYERRPLIEANYNDTFLRAFCKKVGVQHASRERDARDLEDGRYYYTPEEARRALETFVYTDEEIGQRMGRKDDLLSCQITDSLITARLDASIALSKIKKTQRDAVLRRYVYGLPPKNDTERKASNRAVDALARQMNRSLRAST
ncbi:hypothetical protein [Streptomyces sp. NPDC005955]|uniref:hypothetical protein n=1 Tax=Streptomyces sp. NPDC005955 TaxID=3364738 RepID=UPI00367F19F6